jgi:hypothetical protein
MIKRGRPSIPLERKKRRNFTLRGCDEFYDKLVAACAVSGRGMAEEIIARVEKTFAYEQFLFGGTQQACAHEASLYPERFIREDTGQLRRLTDG